MKRLFLLSCILLSFFFNTRAQQPGPFYRQFFFNPYVFNPAYVGSNKTPEANLVYRQQWSNFKDSPITAGFNMQFPTSERVAFGFSVTTDRQVLLRNSSFMATFGYILPIAENQSLRFGLSGGVGLNALDMTADELNTSDPAIKNASSHNFYVDGNFGVLYSLDGLRIGFALTDLFKSNAWNTKAFNEFNLSNLRNRLFSASYKFNVGLMENLSVEPYVLYRQLEDARQDSWEVATLLYYKNHIWTGASYHQHNGIALFMGFNFKEKFKLSYSYEFPPTNSAAASTSSHELHLGLKFKTKKSKSLVKSSVPHKSLANEQPPVRTERVVKDTDMGNKHPGRLVAPEAELILEEPPVTAAPVKETPVEKAKPSVKETPTSSSMSKSRDSFTVTKGHYYVVVSVFSVMSHSVKFSKELIQKGYPVSVVLNPKNKLYYVYIFSSGNVDEAKRIRNEYRWKNLFKEAWIFSPGF
ncbi:MAG TPA: type IX secretion system membrane protein PorP/SprF [Chryseolinea sp.]|nr:type IX secretion system membrane protein PorP/SprF [Chryseolinea sp.]